MLPCGSAAPSGEGGEVCTDAFHRRGLEWHSPLTYETVHMHGYGMVPGMVSKGDDVIGPTLSGNCIFLQALLLTLSVLKVEWPCSACK